MWTLHSYFGRELLKNFLMTCAALTILIVMGGGVTNIFRSEGLGAREMFRIFTYLTPIAVTLILPVSALFSATITFGRAAADNEVLACQAAGINLHRLLLTPVLMGVLVTIATFFSWNFVIPYLTGEIAAVTRQDLPAIVLGQFQKSRPLIYGKFQISSKQCDRIPASEMPEGFQEGHTLLRLTAVTFSEVDESDYVRFGTADVAIIDFDATGVNPKVMMELGGVCVFDAVRKQYYAMERQRLGPMEIPFPLKRKLKFENLPTLYDWMQTPDPSRTAPSWLDIPEIKDIMHGMNREMMVVFMNQELTKRISSEARAFTLVEKDFAVEVSSEQYLEDPEDGRLRLRDVRARVVHADKPADLYSATEAVVELRGGEGRSPQISVELVGDVVISREGAGPGDPVVKKPKEVLPRVLFSRQPDMQQRFESFDAVKLFDPLTALPLYMKQDRMRKKLIEKKDTYVQEIRGELNFRATYSLDGIAIILLGAMLGIIVRNGQVLTAFGISCVPMVFVVIACIVGRNLADQAGHGFTAVAVMWGATAFLYGATCFVGLKVLKR